MTATAEPDETRRLKLRVATGISPQRLDRYLAACEQVGLTRTRIQKLVSEGLVTIDGAIATNRRQIKGGERVEMVIPPLPTADLVAEQIPLHLVHEDEDIIVVDKPAGIVTHPAAGNYGGTLVNALLHHFPKLSTLPGKDRPGIVHRLDKDTSGLIVVAKSNLAYLRLQQMIQRRQLSRTYLALVCGHVKSQSGVIELPIGRSPRDRKKMAVTARQGREAVTKYRVQDRFRSYDLLQVDLETGRTHQIRVHFSHLGHPVFGDPDYGGRHKWHRGQFAPERPLGRRLLQIMARQALHAARLQFTHPRSGEPVDLSSELPSDFRQLLDLLDSEGR